MRASIFSEKFSTHLKNTLLQSQNEAILSSLKNIEEIKSKQEYGSQTSLEKTQIEQKKKIYITVWNMLDAIAKEIGSLGAEILKKKSNEPKDIIPKNSGKTLPSLNFNTEFDELCVKSIIKAIQISHQFGHLYVGTEHLLKAIITQAPKEADEWMGKNNILKNNIEKNARIVLESTSKFQDLTAMFRPEEEIFARQEERKEILEYFGTDLTGKEAQKNIDPVIGREQEIERMIGILCRRHKNNPLLLGEAGVGKTAIVEGLAKKITQGNVPPILANKKIYSIDLGSMVAGSMYRGEFEARLKQALDVAGKDENIILFIDEIHNIIGAGSASGSLDAANMLKPALARGDISIIGATTLEEYKKHIEPDSALERRLAPIIIEEPKQEETKKVLRGIKSNYETFHNVLISNGAIEAAVELSSRYITGKLQPDKAIDLLDEACSSVKIQRSNSLIYKKIKQIQSELSEIIEKKHKAVLEENYSLAMDLKIKENIAQTKYNELTEKINKQKEEPAQVTEEHIARIVSFLTKIPIGKINIDERQKLFGLDAKIKEKILGQDAQIEKIANLIRRSRANVSDPKRPIASFMFLGPSGVGKTETAKQIARAFFGNENSIIHIDMSEFSEGYGVSKLIGSPAGYVGYRDRNAFTDKVRANPYSVVLLDEIEKAHKEISSLLLGILENGEITDATGRKVNFRNCIIIMTSNIGSEEFNKSSALGFEEKEDKLIQKETDDKTARETLLQKFSPEFINRIDSIIVFSPLGLQTYQKIVDQHTNEMNLRLAEHGILVLLSKKAKTHIVKEGFNPQEGARSIRKFFQDRIESEIAKMIINEQTKRKKIIEIDFREGNLLFS